ncbi:MAG: hypothetical protein SVM80_09330 [Halobacteriota archaeon]|nr:hypothetical protein [Halobacteriota archaeon]
MLPKLDDILRNKLSHSYLDNISVVCNGYIYSVGNGSVDVELVKILEEKSLDNMESILFETCTQQIYTQKFDDFTIIITAKRIAPLSFLRNTCQKMKETIREDTSIREIIESEGKTISQDNLTVMLRSLQIPKGDLMLRSTIHFIRPEVILDITRDISGYIWIHSKEGDGLILFEEGDIKKSVFYGECNLSKEEAINRIYSLKEGQIECYKLDRLPINEIQNGLHLLGLSDEFLEVIHEAKKLRQQIDGSIK